MRFLHRQSGPIVEHVTRHGLFVHAIDLWGNTGRMGSVTEIDQLLRNSAHVEKDDFLEFFMISNDQTVEVEHIFSAIKHIESGEFGSTFFIYEYADGGLISVSHKKLDFQFLEAEPAEWWTIADHLLAIERDRIGTSGDVQNASLAAQILIDFYRDRIPSRD